MEKGSRKLYQLPNNSPLRVMVDGEQVDATFHHIDGMYSYCTLEPGTPSGPSAGSSKVFHLAAWQPMVEVDGRWELAEGESDE